MASYCWCCNSAVRPGRVACRNCQDTPTPSEIREACRAIQARWTPSEEQQRRTRFAGTSLWATANDLEAGNPIPSFTAMGPGEFQPLEAGHRSEVD